jgi:hypothetical protein
MRANEAGRRGAAGVVGVVTALAVATAAVVADAATTIAHRAVAEVVGPAVKLGKGTARAYVRAEAGKPREVGVFLSAAAMQGLPEKAMPGHGMTMPDGHAMFEHVLPMPANSGTGIEYVVVNWNPGGHEPPGIYDVPHFDFHFYTLADAKRQAILPSDPEFEAKAARQPPLEQIPTGYILPAPMAVPQMGVHWIDPTSPELNGKPFTTTFIVGSWDGQVIFQEPMITKALLERRADTTIVLPQPAARVPGRFIAGSYRIRWDAAAKGYRVTLTEAPSAK